ncbi:EVE domain-containing protein [Thioalkalivibrio sp. HK1]|uniref:EVE domain-containing protein n=1 Tax=Thioalkalivibrio sp. HK1 TaxID=1469245 RepID=UPI000471B531|nr:EVE domain-containing protein [Thioalkalivibrio sp. HK1]
MPSKREPRRYWLMKTEPSEFGIDDLIALSNKTEPWDGVRNYQARNMMRDEMKKGDRVFFYHSNCETPGIVGIVRVVKEGYPDPTAFDPKDKHYDPKSDPENPRWYLVDVKYERKLKRTITLSDLKDKAAYLEGLALVRRGNRLSVMPVDERHWEYILSLE